MRRKTLLAFAVFAVLASVAAAPRAGLRVEADKENVVASRLAGKWKLHQALTNRLTGGAARRDESGGMEFEFIVDAGVAGRLPARYEKFFKDKQIFLAGRMKRRRAGGPAGGNPFVLVAHRGNPHVVYFRPRGDDPLGDAESFNVMLAAAKAKANDLLFIGGDFNNQPFSAFERIAEATTDK